MKLIKSKVLFDGSEEKENMIIGFEGDEIKYVGSRKPDEDRGTEMILEGDDVVVTPAFIDSHSHIGMVRSGPSTRMGAVAMLRENFIKARKMQGLLQNRFTCCRDVSYYLE